jgi:hypothetical protein
VPSPPRRRDGRGEAPVDAPTTSQVTSETETSQAEEAAPAPAATEVLASEPPAS